MKNLIILFLFLSQTSLASSFFSEGHSSRVAYRSMLSNVHKREARKDLFENAGIYCGALKTKLLSEIKYEVITNCCSSVDLCQRKESKVANCFIKKFYYKSIGRFKCYWDGSDW